MTEPNINKEASLVSLKPFNQAFLAGSPLSYVFKKIEKLSSAIYLVTNLWNDKEPLKWDLRQKSVCLLDEMLAHQNKAESASLRNLASLSLGATEMLSKIDIAHSAGLISTMNAEVVKTEYQKLIDFLVTNKVGMPLEATFFEVGNIPVMSLSKSSLASDSNQPERGDYKGHKRHIKDKDMSFINKNKTVSSIPKNTESNQERRQTILKIVKNKGEISVKDVSGVIKGFSEKTIQRELIAMAEEGILEKHGERRWSRYSMPK